MNEHPILFSSEMVQAIFAGRKTQTRRVVKPQPIPNGLYYEYDGIPWLKTGNPFPFIGHLCPYGKLGDRLWVRESLHISEQGMWLYKADDEPVECATLDEIGMMSNWLIRKTKKNISHCPSIHMPRWASRLTLEVKGVRIERLQDIGEEDAKAEGFQQETINVGYRDEPVTLPAKQKFVYLWDKINADRGYTFESDPWVWLVEFKKVKS